MIGSFNFEQSCDMLKKIKFDITKNQWVWNDIMKYMYIQILIV